MIQMNDKMYKLIHDYKDGWNQEAFRARFSEVLDKYDYIVGDWGYNQLRLKGFFKENNSKGNKDSSISSLQDYIHEYCNFGCKYFVLERQPKLASPPEQKEQRERAPQQDPQQAAVSGQAVSSSAGNVQEQDV